MPRALIRPDILYGWKGPSLLVVTTRGECGPDQLLTGYYFREARFLSTFRLEINGCRQWLCEATSLAPDRLQFSYSFPVVALYGGGGSGQSGDDEPRDERGLPQRGINILLTYLGRALFDLAQLYPEYRIPECVGGYSRSERPTPGAYR